MEDLRGTLFFAGIHASRCRMCRVSWSSHVRPLWLGTAPSCTSALSEAAALAASSFTRPTSLASGLPPAAAAFGSCFTGRFQSAKVARTPSASANPTVSTRIYTMIGVHGMITDTMSSCYCRHAHSQIGVEQLKSCGRPRNTVAPDATRN
jgi:hypothetical protein